MIQTAQLEQLEQPRPHSLHDPKFPPKSKPARRNWRQSGAQLLAAALLCLCAAALPAIAAPALTGVVNVNIASPEELQLLPGIGETRARAIVAERDERGGFKAVDELVEVKGIGEGMLVRLRPYVSLSGKSTAEPLD